MSIIYSYPSVIPNLNDLLIGTTSAEPGNATVSFTVENLISLANAQAGNGTVTGVTILTDTFLDAYNFDPGDPNITWDLGLSATGTPSATTFLRGDNKWETPVLSGIEAYAGNSTITTDLNSINFVGAGVVSSADAAGNVRVNIPGAANAVESIIQGNGILAVDVDGNVTITNSGITGLINGGGVGISQDANGVATLTVTAPTAGTVTSITNGAGIAVTGTADVSPVVSVNFAGASNLILSGVDPDTALPGDTILFNQATSNNVKSTTFGEIQASTLSLVDTSINAANVDTLTNTYDKSQQGAAPNDRTIGAPPAAQIVTLSAQEYTDLGNETPSGIVSNFIYLTTAAAVTPNTVNFTVVDAVTANGGCSYIITTLLNGVTLGGANPTSVTGAPGTTYELKSTVSGFGSCTYSGTNPVILNGEIPSSPSPQAVEQTVSGTLNAAVVNPGEANAAAPTTNITNSGNVVGEPYNITSNNPSQSGTLNSPFNSFNLWQGKVTINDSDNYYFNDPPVNFVDATYSPASGNYTAGITQVVTNPIAATLYRKQFELSYNINIGNIGGTGVLGSQYSITLTDTNTTKTITTAAGLTGTFNTFDSSSSITLTATVNILVAGFVASPSPISNETTVVMNIAKTATLTMPTSTVSSSQGTASMTTTLEITKPTGVTAPEISYVQNLVGGDGGAYTLGDLVSGASNAQISFEILETPSLQSPYQWAPPPTLTTLTGANPTSIVSGTNTPLTTKTAGTIIQTRQQFASSNINDQTTFCTRLTNAGFYVQKATGNTATAPQAGDIVFQQATGTAVVPTGSYRAKVGFNTNPAKGKMVVGSGGLVISIDENFCF